MNRESEKSNPPKLQIKEGPGKMPILKMQKRFEAAITQTELLRRKFNLELSDSRPESLEYKDQQTQMLWVGFALGMRCEERYRKAIRQNIE